MFLFVRRNILERSCTEPHKEPRKSHFVEGSELLVRNHDNTHLRHISSSISTIFVQSMNIQRSA
jgi:hypothetical protein